MSKRNGKLNRDGYFSSQNNIKVLNTRKFKSNSIIYSKNVTHKNKSNINNQITSINIDFNNLNKYKKFLSPRSFINEERTSMDNLKKMTNYKYNNTRNKNISKNSTKNLRAKSTKRENHKKKKFYDYSNKLNDSLIKYKNKKNKSNLKKRKGSKKSSTNKMISYNPSFFVSTPKSSRSKSSKRAKSSRSTKRSKEEGAMNDYSLIIYKNKINNKNYNIKKVSSNTDIKKEIKNYSGRPKSINKKKTISLKNNSNNILINKPLQRATSYDSKKNIRIIINKHIEKNDESKNKKDMNNCNYNHIVKRNININLNADNLSIYKKIFFSTENNTNSNTNYNSNNNSNNNTIKIKNINIIKNINNKNDIKENKFKTNHKEYNIKDFKEKKDKSFYAQNVNKSKESINKFERKKLSFDIIDNNKSDNKDNLGKIVLDNNKKITNKNTNNINDINSDSQNDQNSLIIRIDNNKKFKNHFQYINNNKNKQDNKNEELANIEDNVYLFVTENEQGVNTGINSVKTNNFIINKPKEENLKYSSIKEFLDDNEEQTEISPSQISKIIIGQIDGYKDIIDDDKNINITNDKSKSILELLSKFSFSYMKNNRQSIENIDNLNLFEEYNDLKGEISDCNLNINMTNNSRNMTSDNMPNLTNIKNVDEDCDSEDLSISVFKNNIKSINTHSKDFLNKIFYNKSNSKNDIRHKNFVKNSMNTNNTTISSGNNINKDNLKSNKDLANKDLKNKSSKFSKNNVSKKISPSSSARNNLTNFKIPKNINNSKDKKKYNKNNISTNNRNDKNIIYFKNISKSKLMQKIETTKRQNAAKSKINKNINTNIIFNINEKNKKINMIKNITELLNKVPIKNTNNFESKLDEDNNQTKKISNYNIPVLKIIGENENIIKAYLNGIEKEKSEQNENICSKSESNNINDKNNIQCFIF